MHNLLKLFIFVVILIAVGLFVWNYGFAPTVEDQLAPGNSTDEITQDLEGTTLGDLDAELEVIDRELEQL